MMLTQFPRRTYSYGPTPLEFMPRLTELLGGPRIYIKRDDLLGLAGGGNKTRKLEFLVADALAQGADTLITTGAVQSNHCRLTLAAAAREGLRCNLLLEERVPGSYAEEAVGNNLLFKLIGADEIQVVPAGTDLAVKMQQMAEDERTAGRTPYIIPGGGSNSLGALGYAACAYEIQQQCFDLQLQVDHIIAPSGSGGTHAGLLAGLYAGSGTTPVTGISVRAEQVAQEEKIYALANEVLQRMEVSTPLVREAVVVRDRYVGPGYSLPTDAMTEAIQLFARLDGILLDPVYTGKVAAGLIDMIRGGEFTTEQTLLFLHTGGSPALHAYPQSALKNVGADA